MDLDFASIESTHQGEQSSGMLSPSLDDAHYLTHTQRVSLSSPSHPSTNLRPVLWLGIQIADDTASSPVPRKQLISIQALHTASQATYLNTTTWSKPMPCSAARSMYLPHAQDFCARQSHVTRLTLRLCGRHAAFTLWHFKLSYTQNPSYWVSGTGRFQPRHD